MAIQKAKRTNTITLEYVPSKIDSVNVKQKGKTFFTTVRDYDLSGKTITLKKIYEDITVNYEYDIAQDPEAQENYIAFTNQAFNGSLKNLLIKNSNKTLKTQATTANKKRASVEGTTLGVDVGTSKGGFTSLAASVKESQTETDETVVSIMTEGVPGVTVTKSLSSSDQGDITTLTGRSATGGFLNATIVSGNPKGISTALTAVVGASPAQTKTALKSVSPYPDEAETAVEEDISTDVATGAEKIASKTMKSINNPFKSIDAITGQLGFGSLGLDFGNLLAAALGDKLTIPQISQFGQVMPGLPNNFVLPKGSVAPPNIISSDASTNLRGNLREQDPLPPNVQNSEPPLDLSSNASDFTFPLPADYEFTEVGGFEELESEIRNCKRPLTTSIVYWSTTYSNRDWDSYQLNEFHTIRQINGLGNKAFARLVANDPTFGKIEWHYVIRKDGVIQRGRPISLNGFVPTAANIEEENGLKIGFIAGFNGPNDDPAAKLTSDSITPNQWQAFDAFITAFYNAIPGGSVVGAQSFYNDDLPTGPGFDVETYVSSKYKKTNTITNTLLAPEEVNTQKPVEVVKPSRVNEQEEEPLVPKTLPQPAETKPTTGSAEPTEDQLKAASVEYARLSKRSNRLLNDANALEDRAKERYGKNLPASVKNSLLKKRNEQIEIENKKAALKKDLMNNNFRYDKKSDTWVEIK
jgi:hypothetical protein